MALEPEQEDVSDRTDQSSPVDGRFEGLTSRPPKAPWMFKPTATDENSAERSGSSKSPQEVPSSQAPLGKQGLVTKDPILRKGTKDGCLTCRRRRIKCGGWRPVCDNCVKAKRHCDYNTRIAFRKYPSGLSGLLPTPYPLPHDTNNQHRTYSGSEILPSSPKQTPTSSIGSFQKRDGWFNRYPESNNPQWQSKEAHPNSFNLEQYSEGAERFRPLANLPNYDDFDTSSPQVEFTLEGMEQTGPRRPQEINMAISGDSEPDEAIRQAEQAQPSPLDPSPRFGDLGGRYLESSSLPGWKARRARDESAERWGGFTKERKREEELRYHEEGSLSPGQKSVEVDEQIRRELEDWESPKEVWRDFTEDVASHNATLKPLLPEPQKDLEATDQGKSECTQLRKKLSNAYHSKASFFGAHPIVVMRNAVDRILRPPVPDDKRRIEWTCRCGLRMFDDYQEITSGALEKLQSLLDYSGGREHARNDGRVSSGFRTFQDVKTFVTSMFSRFRNSAQREDDLPQHDFRGSTPENTMTDNSARWNETYVLLNLPYKQTASKIDHIEYWREACNDESFFKVLRRRYDICHYSRNSFLQSLRQVFTLRMISDIRFVKFEMFRGGLTQVHQLDDIPPVGMRHAYDYYPSPAEHIPPIGPNLLLHLYYYPEDADDFTLHVQRVPKKLHGRLEPCPLKGYALGWGLHLTEGVSKVRLSIMGLASSTLSLIFGIVWSVRTAGDVQGGFTIAAYLMMMFLAALGSIQGLLER